MVYQWLCSFEHLFGFPQTLFARNKNAVNKLKSLRKTKKVFKRRNWLINCVKVTLMPILNKCRKKYVYTCSKWLLLLKPLHYHVSKPDLIPHEVHTNRFPYLLALQGQLSLPSLTPDHGRWGLLPLAASGGITDG